jgi:hypothetical protein
MTQQERQDLENKLAIYQRQKVKMEESVHRYESMIEELLAQLEQYPDQKDIAEELETTRRAYEAKKAERKRTMAAISGLEWLLEK